MLDTKLIAFDIIRTEELHIDDVLYQIKLGLSKDKKEYNLFITNSEGLNIKRRVNSEFERYDNKVLELEVVKLLQLV